MSDRLEDSLPHDYKLVACKLLLLSCNRPYFCKELYENTGAKMPTWIWWQVSQRLQHLWAQLKTTEKQHPHLQLCNSRWCFMSVSEYLMDCNRRFWWGLGHRAQLLKCWRQGFCREPEEHHRYHLVSPSLHLSLIKGNECDKQRWVSEWIVCEDCWLIREALLAAVGKSSPFCI